MKPIYHYSTVSEALDELNELGFTYDYNIHQSDIINNTEHQVKHVYRYEGNSDQATQHMVHLLTVKGVLLLDFQQNK
jgi:alpha-D-ribose 1-methylphosphonate 5-triphosphate synthase subunit PhnI